MSETKAEKGLFFKPSIDTQFHIDFEWWQASDLGWRNAMVRCMCDEHRDFFLSQPESDTMVDFIDPETGEVSRRDTLQEILTNHCARQESFLQPNGPLTDSVFRIFLANGNQPLSCRELSEILKKPAGTILKTLSGPRIYRGIKPY
ncbi:hypothetical protein BEQ56_07555 [Anaerolineaceae bacterium oral taxon 439]|nr:hypothetical protein BEQ56_07555 [Anaerolineaceae bacterium oral taxon 439]